MCQMSNGSQMLCEANGPNQSYCSVTHPNGFVSGSTSASNESGGGTGPAALLVAWLVQRHAEHTTNKAIENATSTVLLTIKYSMLLMDSSTLAERLAPYLPPEQKALVEQTTKNLASQSSAFSGAVANFATSWNGADRSSFYHSAKGLEKLYDSGLVPVCGTRSASQMLTGKLDSVRPNLAADIVQALDAVKADEILLDSECTSKEAVKQLNKQAEKARH
jgi:hypothetical protein